MIRIAEIESGSLAEELELQIGSRVIRINGSPVRDGIDLTFLLADSELSLEIVTPEGESAIYEVDRAPGESIGIVPAPDSIRECANECVFCFIDGNPQGVRDTLWLRDDDFRLSFTYGSYVTLTNLGPKGFQRLIDQRISPLYVSVHATEPEVRVKLLKNDRAGLIVEQLQALLGAGLEVHTQVVLCPEWNDGGHLDRTIDDLWELGPGVRSLSVVPVGLTRYNIDKPVRPLQAEEAALAVDQVARGRERALAERGSGWCYAADEMFMIAGRNLPLEDYYDDGALTENGVGAVRRFMDDFERGIGTLPDLPGLSIRVLTGASMAPIIEALGPRLAEKTRATVEVVAVANEFFGDSVTVAGLLGGRDLLAAAAGAPPGSVVLIPAEALNSDDLFIDSLSLEDFRSALPEARVLAGHELTEAVRSL